jgi:regulator of sirC expression with transglutaminase-like and TPR domain
MNEELARIRGSFADLAKLPSESIPLAEAALLIAAEEYPALDVGGYLTRISELADRARPILNHAEDIRAAGSSLTRFLYEEAGLRGNEGDYYDPRNSFLNDVLDRGLGIPITLSIVFLEVAHRLHLRAEGIGLPGHFLVQLTEAGTYVDPFTGQADLREADCAGLIQAASSGRVEFERSMLATQSNRQILVRVLRNLTEIYRSKGDTGRELAALDRLVLLQPGAPGIRRQRARVLEELGLYQRALGDVEQVRRLQPAMRRSERFRAWRRFVREMASRMN